MKVLLSIHSCVMQETGQLLQAGLQPDHLTQTGETSHRTDPISNWVFGSPYSTRESRPFTYEILVEKVLKLNNALTHTKRIETPYVGPRTLLQFLECFCEIFHTKHTEAVADRSKLTKALATLHNTHEQVVQMKTTLQELRQHHDQVSMSADALLKSLTSKSCQLEKLKALMGDSSSVYSAMLMVSELERKLMEADDEDELLALCVDKRTSRMDGTLQKAQDHVRVAEKEEMDAKMAVNKSKETAQNCHNKIDRNTIDQVKSLNNPPHLVGTIMELMLTLLNQYGSTSEQTQLNSSSDENSSSSTPGHTAAFMSKKKRKSSSVNTAKMEKEQWNSIQIAIGDSQRFLDMLKSLKWEEGLSTDATNLILSQLAVPGRNVSLSDSETSIDRSDEKPFSSSVGKNKEGLITVSMARYAAESAALMCTFAVSIVEYNDTLKPYKLALEKLTKYVCIS